jgi:hypothetical protein
MVFGREFLSYLYTTIDYSQSIVAFKVSTNNLDSVLIIPTVTSLEISIVIIVVMSIISMAIICFIARICCKRCGKSYSRDDVKSFRVSQGPSEKRGSYLNRDSVISIRFGSTNKIDRDTKLLNDSGDFKESEESSYINKDN